jgi:hypothetical protein
MKMGSSPVINKFFEKNRFNKKGGTRKTNRVEKNLNFEP